VSTVLYLMPDEGISVAVLTNLQGVGRELVSLAHRLGEVASAREGTPAAAARR
jgi:hypothetical protein